MFNKNLLVVLRTQGAFYNKYILREYIYKVIGYNILRIDLFLKSNQNKTYFKNN